MLRETMMRTMPVAMIAIAELWTDRFHRFRGVRKVPCDMMLKPTQMIARAPIMPSMRVSTSRRASRDPIGFTDGRSAVAPWVAGASVTLRSPWLGRNR